VLLTVRRSEEELNIRVELVLDRGEAVRVKGSEGALLGGGGG